VAKVGSLLFGEADGTHFRIAELEDAPGSQRVSGRSREAVENRHRGFAVQLLVENSLRQAVKGGLAVFHTEGSDALNQGPHDGIGFAEVENRFSHRDMDS